MRNEPLFALIRQITSQIRYRMLYYFARLIVIVLFASILLSPKWLEIFLGTPILLAMTIFGTVVLAITLFAEDIDGVEGGGSGRFGGHSGQSLNSLPDEIIASRRGAAEGSRTWRAAGH